VNREARRQVLRMLPYGTMVLTAAEGEEAPPRAATVHWAMQTSFEPAMVAVALPPARAAWRAARATQRFLLHMLGKADAELAHAFARDVDDTDGTLRGHAYTRLPGGVPLLGRGVGVLDCRVRIAIEQGDHHLMIADVIGAAMRLPRQGRWDRMMLHAADLGETYHYGG
jgi:flavin reductase (DIM6/NTAB) family NADH-FMN oxidoreductase RutF